MARFITRVQLRDAVANDLEKLDNEMKKESFTVVKKTSPAGKEVSRNSSGPREYARQGNFSLQEINVLVNKVASQTGKKYSFTVMKEKSAVAV
jgi:hypothetical protein